VFGSGIKTLPEMAALDQWDASPMRSISTTGRICDPFVAGGSGAREHHRRSGAAVPTPSSWP